MASASSPEVTVFDVPAPVDDVVAAGDELWFLTRTRPPQARGVFRMSATSAPKPAPPPPAQAIGMDLCRGPEGEWRPVFIGAHGILSAAGETLLAGESLFPIADPETLLAVPTCDDGGETWLLFTRAGLRIRHPTGQTQELQLPPDVRSFSGQKQLGFRNLPAYGAALSLYLPRVEWLDANGDGKTDLIIRRQNAFDVFYREPTGLFASAPRTLDFAVDLNVPPGLTPHPIWVNIHGDGRSELVLALTEGLSTEQTRVWWVSLDAVEGKPLRSRELLSKPGLWLPVARVRREREERLLVLSVNTGLPALATSLLTGEVAIETWLLPNIAAPLVPVHTFHPRLELRGEKRIGSQPIATIDFDGDGWNDLVDLSEDRTVVWFRGERAGFAKEPSGRLAISRFSQHIVLPKANGLVLLADMPDGSTHGTWIRAVTPTPSHK